MKITWKTHVVLLFVVITGVVFYLCFSQMRALYVRLALSEFEDRPTQNAANQLAALVDKQSLTPGQIRQALVRLFTPTVEKGEAYPVGTVPSVSVQLPFELTFEHMTVDAEEYVWVGGERQYGSSMTGVHSFQTKPHLLHMHPAPTEPGTYVMEIRYTYLMTARGKWVWQWNPLKGIIWPRRRIVESIEDRQQYTCQFTVPVEIDVVKEVRAWF